MYEIPEPVQYVLEEVSEANKDNVETQEIISRLSDTKNPDLIVVYEWLKGFRRWDSLSFVLCGIQASTTDWSRIAKELRKQGKLKEFASSRAIPHIHTVFSSRQRGKASDHIREFIGRLIEHGFPINEHGTQSNIARISNILLDNPDLEITQAHVAKYMRSIDPSIYDSSISDIIG